MKGELTGDSSRKEGSWADELQQEEDVARPETAGTVLDKDPDLQSRCMVVGRSWVYGTEDWAAGDQRH